MKETDTLSDAYQLFHAGVLALSRAEQQGIRVDVDYCQKKKDQLTRKIQYYERKVKESPLYKQWYSIYRGKTNMHSNHQLSDLLYKHMKLSPSKATKKGQGATDEEALRSLNIPELNLILQARKLTKLRDTYLEAFIRETGKDGYMHPSFNLHTVKTFRSSSSDPNFQNIPKRDKEAMKVCRQAILPRPGHMLVEADFAALEVMIAACYCKDPTLISYLQDKKSDMHLDMAKQIFMFDSLDRSIPVHSLMRSAAKNGFVFAQFYGDYYKNNAYSLVEWVQLPTKKWKRGEGSLLPSGEHISDHLIANGIRSFDQFIEHLKGVEEDFWGRRFKVYHQWRKEVEADYRKKGMLKMHTGFVCSGVMTKNEILNYRIQGSAFHCLLLTFVLLDEAIRAGGWKSRLIGQIHDSILLDAHPSEIHLIKETLARIVKQELPKRWPWIIVPLEIEVEEYEIDGPWIK